MHRIDTATAVPALPAILGAGANPNSFWQSGNPGTGAVPTAGDQDWFNAVQEEIVAVLTEAGIVPTKGTYTQLRDAIKKIVAQNAGAGRVQLQFSSNVQLALMPHGGNTIPINGKLYTIPAGGLLIPNAGLHVSGVAGQNLAASTDYLAFAMDDGAGNAIPDCWPVATGHRMDTTAGNIGVEVRNNAGAPDSTRTLIGLIGTDAAGHFSDFLTRSWFNKKLKKNVTTFSAVRSTTSPTPIEINPEIQNVFMAWADDEIDYRFIGSPSISAVTTGSITMADFDGGAVEPNGSQIFSGASGNWTENGNFSGLKTGLSEGRHYLTIFGAITGGATLSYQGGGAISTGNLPCQLIVSIWG